jgi:integrase
VDALRAHADLRDRTFCRPRTPSFFVSQAGTRLLRQNVHRTFLWIVRRAGLSDRRPHRPRIHDTRHSFAMRTVRDWYADGLDVEPRLPLLSTYLGHVSPSSTYWYLTATPELLALASERLERMRGGMR